MSKCMFPGCTKEAVEKQILCSEHLREWYDANYDKGVYKIYFINSDKFYYGKATDEGINKALSKLRSFLTTSYKKRPNSHRSLLLYFNDLCKKNNAVNKSDRENVFDKYVLCNEVIKGKPFHSINIDENGISFNDGDARREAYKLLHSDNPDIKREIVNFEELISNTWKSLVEQAKEADKKNGTNNCLNDNL